MKRFFALILAIAFAISLIGCADKPSYSRPKASDGNEIKRRYDASNEQKPLSESNIYDNTDVVEAYKSSNVSKLSEQDKSIYEAATEAINIFYSENMTDMDIVLAAHDYIVTHCTYDLDSLSLIPKNSQYSDTPYGVLVNGTAICMGYTTTFQLFMDMLDVNSIIVNGEALNEEHAWNMVELDGEWYHVDCTWDDFVPDDPLRMPMHIYFLVSDSVMNEDHIWDKNSFPSAPSDDLNYYVTNGLTASSSDEAIEILNKQCADGRNEVELALFGIDYFEIGFPDLDGASIDTYWPNLFDDYTVVIFHLVR